MKKQFLKLAALLAVPVALLALASCSSTSDSQAPRGGTIIDSVTATATVDSIDAAERKVVLRREDGSLATYKCGPDVRNFNQIAVGDHVKVTLAEELALLLVKGGMAPAAAEATAVVRAQAGDKPGGKIIETRGFTAKVVTVDTAQRLVTLQMVDGPNKTVKVSPDINLANVNPGDDVGVRLTQAMIITVSAPGP